MFESVSPSSLLRIARSSCSSIAVAAAALAMTGAASASSFTPGNVVVVRVGVGAPTALSNAAHAVFLDEYTPGGTLVQSVPLPTAVAGSNFRLSVSGTATSEGALSLSGDGQYLLLTGYDAAPGTTGPGGGTIVASPTTGAGAILRVIARVDMNGTIDTSTTTTSFSATNIRGAASTNGADLWAIGANTGVIYNALGGSGAGTIVSSNQGNNRTLAVVGGQLYAGSGSGTNTNRGVNTIGSGTPTTTGNLETRLPGLTDATNPSNYGFFFADLSTSVAGLDTLYIADDTNAAGGGITKFSLVSGSWVKNNTVGTTSDAYRGLSGFVSGTTVTLYAARKGGSGSTGGGEIASLVDTAGYNANISGTPSAAIVTAALDTAFRGIVYLPACTAPTISISPSNASVCSGSSAGFTVTAAGTATLSYQWRLGGNNLSDGGNISGATTASLTINPATGGDAGSYDVVVTNACGSATSSAATLTVDTTDSDLDGTPDCADGCPLDPNKIVPGLCGCGVSDIDSDLDGTPNCIDGCPNDPNKIAPGICGCGVADTDSDGDGTPNCNDGCPSDPNKIAPGACGCGIADTDSDGDGTPNCNDGCPNDANKIAPGQCGCGFADTDSDGDGTADCNDSCPADPNKIAPGQCGCGFADTDSDGDGTADCNDSCPADPNKIAPGQCGCGALDTDSDFDTVADCIDNCVAIANPTQADCDLDGIGDVCEIAAGTTYDKNLNGIPDDCEFGLAYPYCTAGTSTNGCVPSISGTGTPSIAATSGFTVACTSLEGQKNALIFYGVTGKKAAVWAPGSSSFLCVKSPTQRTPAGNTGGTVGACDGSFSLDFLSYINTHPAALGTPFSAGDLVYFQTWYRDPSAPGTTNLSDALQVTMAP
jgi:hypothetical protein